MRFYIASFNIVVIKHKILKAANTHPSTKNKQTNLPNMVYFQNIFALVILVQSIPTIHASLRVRFMLNVIVLCILIKLNYWPMSAFLDIFGIQSLVNWQIVIHSTPVTWWKPPTVHPLPKYHLIQLHHTSLIHPINVDIRSGVMWVVKMVNPIL